LARFFTPLRRQIDVGPAREKILLIPVALPVTNEHQLADWRPNLVFCHAQHCPRSAEAAEPSDVTRVSAAPYGAPRELGYSEVTK
jgi:hypothetical protein